MHIYVVTKDEKTTLFTSATAAVKQAAQSVNVKRHSPEAVKRLRKGECLLFLSLKGDVKLEKIKLNDREAA